MVLTALPNRGARAQRLTARPLPCASPRDARSRPLRIDGCLYCKGCGQYTYQPGYGCTACGFVEPGV